MKSRRYLPITFAILAAVFYGFSAPLSKVLLSDLSPYLMASLLYLGAGSGVFIIYLSTYKSKIASKESNLSKKETPYIMAMIALDIVAPILLMIGLQLTSAAHASLLNNLEIVATAIVAQLFFQEMISKRMWMAIILILIAGIILTFEDISSLTISLGSVFIILACIAWGIENNCTRKLSSKNPLQIVTIKGLGSGLGSLLIAYIMKQTSGTWTSILLALLLGFFAYGLSLIFYIRAQRDLGAAKTSAYYASAPFVGVILAFIILQEAFTLKLFIAMLVMIIGVILTIQEAKVALNQQPDKSAK